MRAIPENTVDKRLIRLAYAIGFLIALLALLVLWSQVAGQGHLDLISWYWKLGIALAASFACMKATQAAFEGERAWNRRTLGWLSLLVVLMFGAAMVTYYAHLYYEDQDPAEEGDEQAVAIEEAGAAWAGSSMARRPQVAGWRAFRACGSPCPLRQAG
jgi:hypothetical protein